MVEEERDGGSGKRWMGEERDGWERKEMDGVWYKQTDKVLTHKCKECDMLKWRQGAKHTTH